MSDLETVISDMHSKLPEHRLIEWWAGCNRWVNQGKNEWETIGTATSMHDCDGCEKVDRCKIKKATPVWEWNEEIEKQMTSDWKEMRLL